MNVKFYLQYDIKIILKSHCRGKYVVILPLCMQRCYGRYNVSRNYVDIIKWRYFTPRRNVIMIGKGS